MTRRVAPLSSVAVVVCLALGASIVNLGPVPSLVVPTVLGVMLVVALVRALSARDDGEVQRRLLQWALASFCVHLMVGLAVSVSVEATRYLGADAGAYHSNALEILGHWQHGSPMPRLPAGREGYYYFLAAVDWVFGPYRMAGLAFNATMSAALVPIVYDTTRRLFGARAARMVPPLMVLVPGMILWGSQLLKEATVLFLLAVAVNCGVRLVERVSAGPLLVLMATIPALLTVRGHVGTAAIAGIVVAVALGKRDVAGGLATAVAVVGVVALALAIGPGTSGYNATVNSDLEYADKVRQDLSSSAGSGFDASADISTPAAAISYLPRGLASFMAGPYPWELAGTRQLIAVPDVLAWYFLLPSLWRGWRAGGRIAGRRTLVLVLPTVAITVMLSLLIGNYGTIVRERMQILVLLAPLIALGLVEARNRSSPAVAAAIRVQ